MRICCQPARTTDAAAWRADAAFTLSEMIVAKAILMMVMAGIIVSHLFGVRLYGISKVKLGASDEARAAISLLVSEIRSAKTIRIGQGDLGNFTEVPMDTLQRGSAIQVFPSTNTNHFVRYFWDSSDRRLKRTTNGATAVRVVANYISNNLVFTSEDHLGNILTNNQNNRVIGLTLQFYQIEYPVVEVGPGKFFDFYQLRTRITRRTLE